MHGEKHGINRRTFMGLTAALLGAGGCGGSAARKHPTGSGVLEELPTTPTQRARKRTERSAVGVIKSESYEENIFAQIKPHIKDLQLPNLHGKTVVLKPNMVEFRANKPVTTNPAVLIAAAQLADYLGAREIIVGEGPGHMRDTEMLLERSQLGAAINKLGVRFVDLNLDQIECVPVSDSFAKVKEFYLPQTICADDVAVISIPKMKTHHWVGITASMKNLFGTVPGRKYGWPKNILHCRGIPASILDLQHLVKPVMCIVDGIVAMEGDGPINGTAKHTGLIMVGADLAAVDATCARVMRFPFSYLGYIKTAGEVVGNIDTAMIDLVGVTALESVSQTFQRPKTFISTALLNGAGQGAS